MSNAFNLVRNASKPRAIWSDTLTKQHFDFNGNVPLFVAILKHSVSLRATSHEADNVDEERDEDGGLDVEEQDDAVLNAVTPFRLYADPQHIHLREAIALEDADYILQLCRQVAPLYDTRGVYIVDNKPIKEQWLSIRNYLSRYEQNYTSTGYIARWIAPFKSICGQCEWPGNLKCSQFCTVLRSVPASFGQGQSQVQQPSHNKRQCYENLEDFLNTYGDGREDGGNKD
ncbi:hypothetical protein FANTH_11257 [Fusarium anthophilum]|uniref:Uncharacterized protein n=1 Tax=Fusarium anthophilum TaxID=48485 RepID=A0A8H4YYW8_9HYPO|nr:hypothetical protein FANTH_11257 [Fusarium anthophilum]